MTWHGLSRWSPSPAKRDDQQADLDSAAGKHPAVVHKTQLLFFDLFFTFLKQVAVRLLRGIALA
jgi:hypothetical protein